MALCRKYPGCCPALGQYNRKNILTCGSKEMKVFTSLPDFQNRIYARILPEPSILQKCIDLGFKPTNMICIQGPFSRDLNLAMMKHIGAEILVTKDSGPTGGYLDKLEASKMLGIKVIVIGRPLEQEGYTFDQLIAKLKAEHKLLL